MSTYVLADGTGRPLFGPAKNESRPLALNALNRQGTQTSKINDGVTNGWEKDIRAKSGNELARVRHDTNGLGTPVLALTETPNRSTTQCGRLTSNVTHLRSKTSDPNANKPFRLDIKPQHLEFKVTRGVYLAKR